MDSEERTPYDTVSAGGRARLSVTSWMHVPVAISRSLAARLPRSLERPCQQLTTSYRLPLFYMMSSTARWPCWRHGATVRKEAWRSK